jgi:protease YdgD
MNSRLQAPAGIAHLSRSVLSRVLNRRLGLAALAVAVMTGWTGTVGAGDGLTSGIIGDDNRQIVTETAPPFTAIGHVNAGGERRYRNFCTGTLIAPGVVLTAGYCVMDMFKNTPLAAKDVHFVAGVRKDQAIGHSRGKCLKFPEGFEMRAPDRTLPDIGMQLVSDEFFKRNLAIIVLADAIPEAGTAALADGEAMKPGAGLIHAGYGSDRRYRLSADRSCKAVSISDGIAATTCDSLGASRGGPIFVDDAGALKLGAVLVGTLGKSEATLAVPLSEWPDMPLDANCP